MSTSQIVSLVMVITILGGGMFYFMMQPKTMVKREAECVAAATTLPLANTTTGIGRTAVIAECD
mgnify:CR=1 FL=1